MNAVVLFVNSTKESQQAMQATMAPLRLDWQMHFVLGAQAALAALDTHSPGVIITELLMPDIDGVELLRHVARQNPSILRFAFTPSDGLEAFSRIAIPVHQYLPYPCGVDDVQNGVERAVNLRNVLNSDSLQQLISELLVMPSMPDLYLRVMEEFRSPDCSLQSIGRIIERDQAMSAKVVQLVNSAYFALRYPVATPTLAVSMLGLEIIKSLILLFEVFSQFNLIKSIAPDFDLDGMQRHSLIVGNHARLIARRENIAPNLVDSYYMAGLFHDVGKLILVINQSSRYRDAHDLSRQHNIPLIEAEQEIFGASHAELGAYLLALWGYTDPIVEACAFHHRPGDCGQHGFNLVNVLHAIDAFDGLRTAKRNDAPLNVLDTAFLIDAGLGDHLATWQSICEEYGLEAEAAMA